MTYSIAQCIAPPLSLYDFQLVCCMEYSAAIWSAVMNQVPLLLPYHAVHPLSCGVLVLTVDAALPKIQSVTVTPSFVGTSPNANPSLEVSWTAVDDPAVSYVVRYSTLVGTMTSPPDGAGQMSANGNSVTLSANLAPDKRSPYTYYIWVAAVSAGDPMGEFSDRASGRTLTSELKLGLMIVFPI